MSRDWSERKYVDAENLWFWVDDESNRIDLDVGAAKQAKADSYKLLLMGRREMLGKLCDWLHENESTLGEVAKFWGLREKEEG